MLPFRNLFAGAKTGSALPALSTEIHLQNDLIVVHPKAASTSEETIAEGRDETILSGSVSIVSESNVLIWNIRIALVVVCTFRRPSEESWGQGVIYEQSRVFNHLDREARISTSSDRRNIHRHIDFALMVPGNIATHEYLKHGMIVPQVRVSVEFSENNWSPVALAALPTLPPVYLSEPGGITTIAGRHMRTESYTGSAIRAPPPDPPEAVMTRGSSSIGVPQHPVQTWIKNFAIIANPNPSDGTNQLRSHKKGFSAGAGEWDLYWWSDVFSIGGYVYPRLELKHASPDITIFSIHVILRQSYSIVPVELFKTDPTSPNKIEYPSENIPLLQDGQTPSTKRPRPTSKILFSGQTQRYAAPNSDGVYFTWQPDRVRIPDDHHARPTRSEHTVSPFDIQHELSLRVFFSVRGESLNGEPIEGDDDTGEMRMLVINFSQQLSSCCCIKEWVSLPSYEECVNAPNTSATPYCACCYNIEDFPPVPFSQAFPSPEPIRENDGVKNQANPLRRL